MGKQTSAYASLGTAEEKPMDNEESTFWSKRLYWYRI